MRSLNEVEAQGIVVIGASLGGVRALKRLCSTLPRQFAAPICVVLHVGAHRSILPEILSSAGALPAVHPSDGELLSGGRIYVAPPDLHMRVEGQVIRLVRGPKEHHSRPAIDPLFRSAARSFGARTVGVVLTGLLDDGTPGMQAVKEFGGVCVVQDPAEAQADEMPKSAMRHVAVDHCVGIDAMAPLLTRLVTGLPERHVVTIPNRTTHDDDISLGRGDPVEHLKAIAAPSTFTCPDCHGTLWQLSAVSPPTYRCHTGHAFTLMTLRSAQSIATDEALWSAIRALQEKRELALAQLREAEDDTDGGNAVAELRSKTEELRLSAEMLRRLVMTVDESEP